MYRKNIHWGRFLYKRSYTIKCPTPQATFWRKKNLHSPLFFQERLGWHTIDGCVMYSYVLLPTASPSVTSLKPCYSYNCIVPKTLQDNVTFECIVYSTSTSCPIWEITHSQYFSSQLPLKNYGLQISSGSNLLRSQGYSLKNPFQNFSTLDISQ